MPEIGECYTIARQIPAWGVIKKLTTSSKFKKYIAKNSPQNIKSLVNWQLGKPQAVGKSIWFPLQSPTGQGAWLISQLGMTGNWRLQEATNRHSRHNHLVIENFAGKKLVYSDPRMFGKMRLFFYDSKNKDTLPQEIIKLSHWGLDPWKASPSLLHKRISSYWLKSSKNVKSLMLEQNRIFGIGNYLASEILWQAKISPLRLGKNLSLKNISTLIKSMKSVIGKAIKTGGYSFGGGYYHPDGSVGQMNRLIKVYGQSHCPHCHNQLKIMPIQGRTTYYCPQCQK